MGFPCGSAGKESACSAGDLASIPGLGRSRGDGTGYPLQYSGLENPMDSIVHVGCREPDTTERFHFHSSHRCVFSLQPIGGEQYSLVLLLYQQYSPDPLIHYCTDVHFDPLVQELSARLLHCLTLFSYVTLRGGTLNLCKYLILPQTFCLFIDLFISI